MRAPVLDLSIPTSDKTLRLIVDMVTASVGRVTDALDVAQLLVPAGHVVAAGATVSVPGTTFSLNLADSFIDQASLVIDGKTAAGGPIPCQLYDVTASQVIATVALTAVQGVRVGTWTNVQPVNAEHTFQLRVVGDSVNAQTLYSVHARFRTSRFTK